MTASTASWQRCDPRVSRRPHPKKALCQHVPQDVRRPHPCRGRCGQAQGVPFLRELASSFWFSTPEYISPHSVSLYPGGLAGALTRLFPHLEELRLTGDALLPTPFELYVQRIIDEALQDVLNDAVAGAAAAAAGAAGQAAGDAAAAEVPPAADAPAEAGEEAAGAGPAGDVGGGGAEPVVLGGMHQAAVQVGRAAVSVDAAVAGHVLGCLAAGLPRLRGLAASSQLLLQPSACVLTGLEHVTVLSPLQLAQVPGAVLRLPQLRTLTLERVDSRWGPCWLK